MVRIQDWFEYKTQWRIWEITKKICNYKTHPNRRRISIITLIDPPQKVGPLPTPFFVKRKSLATHCTCSTTGTAGDSLRFNFICASWPTKYPLLLVNQSSSQLQQVKRTPPVCHSLVRVTVSHNFRAKCHQEKKGRLTK